MYRCPTCWQEFLTCFDPCPGCSSVTTRKARATRARERRHTYDPIGQIESAEFWALWRLYAVCPCCGGAWGSREHISLDHMIPLSKGGPNTGENVQPLCQRCNLWKSDHTICFDKAFVGRVTALPEYLWHYLPAPASTPSEQMSLLTVGVDTTVRFPNATPHQLEQATLQLTREAQALYGGEFQNPLDQRLGG